MGFDLLLDQFAPAARNDRLYGVVSAVVTNNQDPDKLGRVKLKFPWLSDQAETFWARIAMPMAGNGRGLFMLPEVNDEVLVAFEHGMIDRPFVIGGLWNGKDKPPETNADGKNNLRVIKSRSGHTIRLDDTDGKEKIEIVDKSGKNSIVFDTAQNTLSISADADITIASRNGTVKLSGMAIDLAAQGDVKVEAHANMDLQATAQMKIKGATVDIN